LARRLVVEDQKGAYAFRHPRLARHVRGAMRPEDRAELRGRIMAQGEALLRRAQGTPGSQWQPSKHVVEYYRGYIETEGAKLATWMTIVSPEWQRVWKSHPRPWEGFLADVRHAHAHAATAAIAAQDPEGRTTALAVLVRCALVEASLLTVPPLLPPHAD